ncbi:MAG: hypothetical protein PVS3B1_32460 [Ktedonobacteraceae bacterium]
MLMERPMLQKAAGVHAAIVRTTYCIVDWVHWRTHSMHQVLYVRRTTP